MELPLTNVEGDDQQPGEAAGQENLRKDDEELGNIAFDGVRPVLHVHSGQNLSHKEKGRLRNGRGTLLGTTGKREGVVDMLGPGLV
jgi:hypothetical protein